MLKIYIVFSNGVPYLYGEEALSKFLLDEEKYKNKKIIDRPKLFKGNNYAFFKGIASQIIASEMEKIGVLLNYKVELCTNLTSFVSKVNFIDYRYSLSSFLDYDSNPIYTVETLLVPDGIGLIYQLDNLTDYPSVLGVDFGANKTTCVLSKKDDSGSHVPIGNLSTIIKTEGVKKLRFSLAEDLEEVGFDLHEEFRNDSVDLSTKCANFTLLS